MADIITLNDRKTKEPVYPRTHIEAVIDDTNTPLGTIMQMRDEEVDGKLTELATQVIYDVSANNGGATFSSLSALLSSENLSTLIPSTVRCGGMSIRFVQSSDNKYVQYRLMANSFSTTASDWQGIDDEPTAGSKNLVESGGVAVNNNSIKLYINTVNSTFDAVQWGEEVILLDSLTLNENQRVRIDIVNSLNYTEADAIRIYDNVGNIVNTINTIRVDDTNRYVNYTPSSNINGYSIFYLHKGNASSTVSCTIQVQNAITGEKDDFNTQIVNNSTKILKVKSIRYLGSGYAVGDYYITDIDGSPRLVKSVNSSGAVTSYIEYEKSKNILIEYNNRIYSYNTDGNLQEIAGNFVEIYGLYDVPANPQIGTYYVSSGNQLRLIKSLYNGRPYTWFTIPFDASTIYKYYNDFYFWNGTSLVKFGTANVINLVSLFESPTTSNINDYFVNESGTLKMVSTYNSTLDVTPSKNDIYLYEGKIYKYITIGQSHLTGNDVNWFVSNNDIIKLSGYGYVPSQPKVGDYYYNGTYLRIITRLNAAQTVIYDYVNVEFSNKSLYLYNGVYYKYDGSKLVLLEAPQEKNLQVSSIPYYVDNTNKKMVLCGVLYDNSKTPQDGYSVVSHPEPIGWLYYDKEAQDALYFAKFTAERIEKLLDWDDTITSLSPLHYSFAVCPNMDIICVPRGELLLNRDNSPIIYRHQDYTQPILLNVQKQNSAGTLVKPTGWFGNVGVNVDYADGTIIFGEYTRDQTEPANIWKVSAPYNDTDNWEIVYGSQGTGEGTREVEHFHAINFDVFTGRLYAVSGDSTEESKIYESTDDGDTWAVVYGGVDSGTRMRARALNWVFTKEGAFYGSDQGPLLVKIGRGNNDVLDFTTIQIVVDKQNKQYIVENAETSYEVYYTCLCDSPYGILLLGYQQLGNANPLPIYFYDIKNNTFIRTFLSYPLQNSGGTGYNPNGFRCDAVSVYQSVFEKKFVCGFGNIDAYIGISGNNGSELSNVTLNLT